ncbi:unnamed protein product [Auanema sp. JU1783]|nr:unnamed protein product [Auanema sp. JU1783]
MFKLIFVVFICLSQVTCQTVVFEYDDDVTNYYDSYTGKVDLFNVCMKVYQEVFYPLVSNPILIKNITAQSLYKSVEQAMHDIHPNVQFAWNNMTSSLRERAQTLPSPKLTQFAECLIDEAVNGNIFYYFIKDKILLWSIQQINKIGYEALYRIWYYEHNISADVYGIVENYYNISSLDATFRNYINIDKENYLYKAEEL